MTDGISYFPLDVCVNDKIRLIEAEFGLKGFAIIVKLYQKIHGGFGYYCEWTNDVGLLFSRDVGEGYSSVSEIVSAAIRRGIFDSNLYEKYQILTSEECQEKYFSAVSRRKQVNVKAEYLLVKVAQFSENVNILSENVSKNQKNAVSLEQSKEKKSKVNKSINNNNIRAYRLYDEKSGFRTSTTAWEGITDYLNSGMSDDVICAVIEDAAETAERFSWRYVDSVLRDKQKKGILTLSAYKRDKAEWERSRKRDSSPPANEPQYKPIVLELAKYRGERT